MSQCEVISLRCEIRRDDRKMLLQINILLPSHFAHTLSFSRIVRIFNGNIDFYKTLINQCLSFVLSSLNTFFFRLDISMYAIVISFLFSCQFEMHLCAGKKKIGHLHDLYFSFLHTIPATYKAFFISRDIHCVYILTKALTPPCLLSVHSRLHSPLKQQSKL